MNFLIKSNLLLFINIGYSHLLLTRKRSIKGAIFLFMINELIMLFGALLSDIFLKDTIFYNYAIFILLFTFSIYFYLVFEESISIKIFTAVTVWLFSITILIISSYIVGLFLIKDFNRYKSLSMILRIHIQLFSIPIIYFFQRPYKEMLKLVSNKVINIISLYSSIILLFLVKYYEFNASKPISSYGFFNGLMFIIIIISSYIIIFIAICSVNKNVELQYKFKIIDTQIELQKQNYKNLNKSLEDYHEFKHDIRHHILAIKTMMDTKNYIAASEYMDKFNKNEMLQNVDILCDNFTIDSILKYYVAIAKKYDIKFIVNVNIPQDINIDNLDLSIVFGNCIENAIEACKNIKDESNKYIDVKAEIKGLQVVVKIINSFSGQVLIEDNLIKTIKNGKGHGIGISNVKKTTEKYNGYFNVEYDDKEFQVYIIMNHN